MTDSIVFQQDVVGPATHAIVIGVGTYPHLLGGDSTPYSKHEGLGQLSSPPVSARRVAEWLSTHRDALDRPLASLRVLISPAGDPFEGEAVQIPTFKHASAAIKAWKAAGDTSEEHCVLFYYCGHGLGNGTEVALLMSDFGSDPDNAFDQALDFGGFRVGMAGCAARRQLFSSSTPVERSTLSRSTPIAPSGVPSSDRTSWLWSG